jgi:hypothetical protein
VPSPSKPCGKARRKLKKIERKKLDLPTSYLPNKFEEEGRPYHFPSCTSSLNTQQIKNESALSKLEKEGMSKR